MISDAEAGKRREPAPPPPAHERRALAGCTVREDNAVFRAAGAAVSLVAIMARCSTVALPALQAFGPRFFVSDVWNPVTKQFGALAPIYGTLVTSAIALLIGVPVSFGIALFLTEMCPPLAASGRSARRSSCSAAIPSIIYGMWGLFVFAPVFADYVQPWLAAHARAVAGSSAAVPGPAHRHRHADRRGSSCRSWSSRSSPSVMRDVFEVVPPVLQGVGVRPRVHDLGSGLEHRAALHQGRGHRRHHARARARARRDDGGHLRDRQRATRSARRCSSPATPSRRRSPTNSPRPSATAAPSSLIALGLVLFVLTFIVLAARQAHCSRSCAKREGDRRARDHRRSLGLYRRRLIVNRFNLAMSLADAWRSACSAAVDPVDAVRARASRRCRPRLFTQMTPPPGATAGCSTRSSAAS